MTDLDATDLHAIEARVCPFLGLPHDPASHYSFAELGHRCHAKQKAAPIELAYQASVCLGGRYERCARFMAAERHIPTWHPAAITAQAAPTTVVAAPTTVVAAPVDTRITSTTRSQRGWKAAAVVVVAGIGLGALVLLAGSLGRAPAVTETFSPAAWASATGSANPTSTIGGIASESLAATQPPAPTVMPTTAPMPTLRPSPTPSPVPSPIIHIVQRGETLKSIALSYGVPMREIIEANGIADPDHIRIGQELVIPTAGP